MLKVVRKLDRKIAICMEDYLHFSNASKNALPKKRFNRITLMEEKKK